jgi:pyrroloquinoline quinone biosynthesis protein E
MKPSAGRAKDPVLAAIPDEACPALAPGVRLHSDPLTAEPLLLYPEGVLPLDATTADIVRLCDGSRTVATIIHSLAGDYDIDSGTLRTDVCECLAQLRQNLLMVLAPARPPSESLGISPGHNSVNVKRTGDERVGMAQPLPSLSPFRFRPYLLLAELTYRCPLHCPYCSNPVSYPSGEELSTADWCRVLGEAGQMGVLHVGFSGGEPLQRPDLPQLVNAAREAGLYSNLITSAIGLNLRRVEELKSAGLDNVQISFQSDEENLANHIAGTPSHARKLEAARMVRELGFPLTVNIVLHRGNIGRVEQIISLAESLGARRLELANTQYYGSAFRNRLALLPTRGQVVHAAQVATAARARLLGRMEILLVTPDYYSERPKPCMNGWGRRFLTINPVGQALPCPTAGEIKDLRFDNVRTRNLAWIWTESEAFNRFRGNEWMPAPCRDCEFREVDFGGCRCQAALVTGRADVTDPACSFSPHHNELTRLVGDANLAGRSGNGDPMAPFPFPRQNPSAF